jgi:hypothetical protein
LSYVGRGNTLRYTKKSKWCLFLFPQGAESPAGRITAWR